MLAQILRYSFCSAALLEDRKMHTQQFNMRHTVKFLCLFFAIIIVINVWVPSFAQETDLQQNDYIVKLFYFRPNDREAQPDIDTKIDEIIKKTQNFYGNVMESHGFDRKTFRFETDGAGNAVVHHVIGKHGTESYTKNPAKSFGEIDKRLYKPNKTVRVVYVDHGKKVLPGSACGLAYPGKRILIPAAGGCFGVGVTAHELGHAFGLPHGVGGLKGMSVCAAVALNVNRYFNPNERHNRKDNEAQIKILSSITYPPNNPHFFFDVIDPDSLILARFIEGGNLHSCDILSGEKGIAKFTTYGKPIKNNKIKVVTYDVNGGGTFGKSFLLDGVKPYMDLDVSVEVADKQDGLIGYWTVDEAKGPYVFNMSRNDHHAIIKEGVILQPNSGKIGGALETKWKHGATIENGAELINGLHAFTVALWVKSNGIGSDRGLISTKRPRKKDDSFTLRYDAQGSKGDGINVIKATIRTTDGIQTYESVNNVQTTEWQHIAMTWKSGQKLKLYINGVLDQPTFNSPAKQGKATGADRFVLGKGSHDNHTSWRGMIDDVRLYNLVLNAKDIANLPRVTQTDKHFHGVSIAGVADLSDDIIIPNADVKYILTVTNTGNIHDRVNLEVSEEIDAILSQTSVSLASGESSEVTLTIPSSVFAKVGDYVAKITVTSESDNAKIAHITTTTTIKPEYFQ